MILQQSTFRSPVLCADEMNYFLFFGVYFSPIQQPIQLREFDLHDIHRLLIFLDQFLKNRDVSFQRHKRER